MYFIKGIKPGDKTKLYPFIYCEDIIICQQPKLSGFFYGECNKIGYATIDCKKLISRYGIREPFSRGGISKSQLLPRSLKLAHSFQFHFRCLLHAGTFDLSDRLFYFVTVIFYDCSPAFTYVNNLFISRVCTRIICSSGYGYLSA